MSKLKDDWTSVAVTRKTRKLIHSMRNPDIRRRTADDVIQDAIAALKEKESK